jgi:hypothetical protein
MKNVRLSTCATLMAFLLTQAAALAQPPGSHGAEVISATIQIDKLEPQRPTEGQTTTVYVTVTNWLPSSSSGWVSARFENVPNQRPDSHKRIDALPSKASTSLVFEITTPHPGESTTVIATYYDREYVKPLGLRQRLLAQAALHVDILHSLVTKRISGRSYFNQSQPDPHDSFSDVNGYLLVTHDPGCGVVGNDGTDQFFTDKSLPPGVKIERVDFTQFWPRERGCTDPWSIFNSDIGSYSTKLDSLVDSVKWHNACTGPYNNKDLYYLMSFVISMPTGTDIGETLHDAAEDPPDPPPGYSLTEQLQPTTNCSGTTKPIDDGRGNAAPDVRPAGPYINPAQVHRKEPFTVAYVFTNFGNAPSESFDATLCIDNECEKDTKTVPKLNPSQSATIQWNINRDLGDAFVHSADLRLKNGSGWPSQFTTY